MCIWQQQGRHVDTACRGELGCSSITSCAFHSGSTDHSIVTLTLHFTFHSRSQHLQNIPGYKVGTPTETLFQQCNPSHKVNKENIISLSCFQLPGQETTTQKRRTARFSCIVERASDSAPPCSLCFLALLTCLTFRMKIA